MRCATTTMRSLATIALLTMPLTGCVPELLLAMSGMAMRPETATVIVTECPDLPAPTLKAVDALEAAARTDPATAAWVTDLDQHYDALGRCGRKS